MFRRLINYFMLRNLKKRHRTDLARFARQRFLELRERAAHQQPVDLDAILQEYDDKLLEQSLEIQALKEQFA